MARIQFGNIINSAGVVIGGGQVSIVTSDGTVITGTSDGDQEDE